MGQNSWASNFWPMNKGICLAMIKRPMAASIPSMAAAGKIALNRATLSLARTSCTNPAMQIATSTSG